jgi:hydroxypyruvate isomerase
MDRRAFNQLALGTALSQLLPHTPANAADSPTPPHFSVMLWTLEKQTPFEHCIDIVQEAGYQGIELTGEFHQWLPEQTRQTMARMRTAGLVFDLLSGVHAGFANTDGAAELLSELATQFRYAKELESPQVNLKSGPRIPNQSPQAQRTACVENLKRVADLAAKNNIEIVIEPIDALENPTIYLTSVTEAFEIVREVQSPHIKVLYDFYHEQRGYGNLIEKLEKYIDIVGLVHIADVPGRHEPGTGEVDYTNIYSKLAELKYNRFITMEFYPTKDPVTTLKAARVAAQEAGRWTSSKG